MKDNLGDIARTGLPALLHLIYEKGDAAGELEVMNEPARKRFFFKNGMAVAASSNILSEVLGRLLMSERIISQKDYETSLEVVLRGKKKHGAVLIAMGLITPVELDRFLTLQLKRRLFSVFGWRQGEYRYVKSEALPAGMDDRKPLHPAPLILEGITLGFYPPGRAREDLGRALNAAYRFTRTPGKYRPEDFNINLQEKRFLESFDGSRPLKDVIEAADLLRGRANALALSFIITGMVEAVSPLSGEKVGLVEEEAAGAAPVAPGPERYNAEILFMKARTALGLKDYTGAIEALKKITDLNPAEGEYWAYLGWAIYSSDPARLKEAGKMIRDAIDLNNELETAWHFLGKLMLAEGDSVGAEKCFRTALAKNPWALESLSELKRLEIKKLAAREAEKKYMEAFAFPEDPFPDAPGLRYLELSPGRTNALEAVINNIKKKTGPVLIEGAAGAGKTSFCIELLRRLSGEKVLAACILRPEKKELLLIKAINDELGCAVDTSSVKDELLSLGMRVAQNRTQGGHAIIIIDEADKLSPGCVKLVQYLTRLKPLQLILLADPSFSDFIKAPEFEELDKKLSARHSLDPLTLEETEDYCIKMLNGPRGAAGEFSVTDEALRLLFEQSAGLPAGINRISASLLERAALLGRNILDIETPEEEKEEYIPPVLSYEEQISGLGPASLEESPAAEAGERPGALDAIGEETIIRENASVKAGPVMVETQKPEPQAAPVKPAEIKAEEKPPQKTTKTKIILLLILIVLAGILAWPYISAYLLGSVENAGKTPSSAPAGRVLPKEMNAPLTGSNTVERVPETDAQKAQDKASNAGTAR